MADLIANDDGAPTASDGSLPRVLVNGWTEATLRQHFNDSSEKMQEFLIYLAEHADQEVESDEVAKAIGYPNWNSVAGMLGAATRRARNHFGREYGPWTRRRAKHDRSRLMMPESAAGIVLDEAGK